MALQAWVGRTAGQLDADSPLDITLFNSIDDDLIHLKQVAYGDGAGGFYTAADGHNHDGVNSRQIFGSGIAKSVNTLSEPIAATVSWTASPGMVMSGFYSTTADIRLELNHLTVGWQDTANTVGQATLFDSSGNVRFRNSHGATQFTVYFHRWTQ